MRSTNHDHQIQESYRSLQWLGKTHGTVSREAAFELVEEIMPDETQLVALSMLILGDEAAGEAVVRNPAVSIDGCKLACASKMLRECGGSIAQEVVVLDVYRRNRQFRSKGITELNEGSQQLARAVALEIATSIESLQEESSAQPALSATLVEGTNHA